LVRNFMDMAAAQPRRYIFAVSVSAQAQVYAYIYGPSDIWYERLGDLPSTGEWNDSHQRLVRFLLLLYQQLPGDYGFLVPKEGGVYSPFSTNDIPTLVRADGSEAPLDADTETVLTGEILVTEYVGTDIGVHLTHAAWQT
ncbi:hypothetical protein IWQ56_005991, partial [Coemansia nantahalensis]